MITQTNRISPQHGRANSFRRGAQLFKLSAKAWERILVITFSAIALAVISKRVFESTQDIMLALLAPTMAFLLVASLANGSDKRGH